MISFSHPTGNANVRAALDGLYEKELLSLFHTTVSLFPGDALDRVSSISGFSDLKRRSFDPKLKPLTKSWPWLELGRMFSAKTGLMKLIRHETGIFSVDSIYRDLDKRVAKSLKKASKFGVKGVYAYEDGARNAFIQANNLQVECLYDLPIGYWRAGKRLLEIERELRPEWASTLKSFQNSEAKQLRKDEELRLANRIFVASKFTAKTLADFPGNLSPIEVIPYGFPPVNPNLKLSTTSINHPLKLLFVGGLSQRKGIANLFEAVEDLKNYVELTVIGQKADNECIALNSALNSHRWIPSLSNKEVLEIMRRHDVLVFPSLFEGFGLVITEAMSQGVPVITTERTAGPDLIKHGHNGWIVEAGSTEALKCAIINLISNRKIISCAGHEARKTASQRPWEVYGKELAIAVKRHFLRS